MCTVCNIEQGNLPKMWKSKRDADGEEWEFDGGENDFWKNDDGACWSDDGVFCFK